MQDRPSRIAQSIKEPDPEQRLNAVKYIRNETIITTVFTTRTELIDDPCRHRLRLLRWIHFLHRIFFSDRCVVTFFFSSRNLQSSATTSRQEHGSLAVAFGLPDGTFIARVKSSTRKEYGVDSKEDITDIYVRKSYQSDTYSF